MPVYGRFRIRFYLQIIKDGDEIAVLLLTRLVRHPPGTSFNSESVPWMNSRLKTLLNQRSGSIFYDPDITRDPIFANCTVLSTPTTWCPGDVVYRLSWCIFLLAMSS